MLRIICKHIVAISVIGFSLINIAFSNNQTYDIGVRAYIYAFPLVLMEMTKNINTNVPPSSSEKSSLKAPVNHFANMKIFPMPGFQERPNPTNDTLDSSAWLDLSKEPIILSLPDTSGRYYQMSLLDGWTDVFFSLGKRTTGTRADNFAIVGPTWQGTLPPGVKEIRAPTNMVWILGRTQTNGLGDCESVNQIQKGYKLTPLSAWNKPDMLPPNNVDHAINPTIPAVQQVFAMDAIGFFKQLAQLLKNNPPYQQDLAMLKDLEKIGIKPGNDLDVNSLSFQQISDLNRAIQKAQEEIVNRAKNINKIRNGWSLNNTLGNYGLRYLDRAAVALTGLGTSIPQDAIFITATVDEDGERLNGNNNYLIHFEKNEIPATNAFWSLSIYNPNNYFIINPVNRYSIGDRDQLQLNNDGSLDIYIEHESPGDDKEKNWLPAPNGPFNLTLRLYWPKDHIIKGQWTMPAIQRIQ